MKTLVVTSDFGEKDQSHHSIEGMWNRAEQDRFLHRTDPEPRSTIDHLAAGNLPLQFDLFTGSPDDAGSSRSELHRESATGSALEELQEHRLQRTCSDQHFQSLDVLLGRKIERDGAVQDR